MKIGILTFHRSINYGAVTQCYALATEIQKRFPSDIVEVIDYAPKFRIEKYIPSLKRILLGSTSRKNSLLLNAKIIISQIIRIIRHPDYLMLERKKYKAFQNSMEYLPLSKEQYTYNDVDALRKMIYGNYDIIVVGSDCVWEWTSVPLPNAYYLCGDFGALKLSYAASAGTDQVSLLSDEERQLLRQSVSDFAYIGVRDTSTEYVLKQLEIPGLQWNHNCDPTTFLDRRVLLPYKEKVEVKFKALNIPEEKIIIGIMGSEKYAQIARGIFGDKAVYIALYIPNRYCDYQFLDLPVLEWASSFGLFDLTFTTFFHGTMLSLVNQTPVLSFDTLPESKQQITKLRELYNRLGLQGFYHRINGVIASSEMEVIKKTAWAFVENPPCEQIAEALKREARSAESFFEYLMALHDEENREINEERV